MQDESSKEDSSVWSSYSDLFTNVAIIFLVMFVFALVKSGVKQVEAIHLKKKHEDELRSKLSPQDMEKSRQRLTKIQQKVEEMKTYEDVIDQKVQELNTYAKKLQENKEVLKEVIDSQLKQDSLMKAAEERLAAEMKQVQEKKLALAESEIKINHLNEELERVRLEVRQKEDTLQRRLDEKVAEAAKKEEELKNLLARKEVEAQKQVAALRQDIETVKAEASAIVAQKENELTRQVETLGQKLETAKSEAARLNQELSETTKMKASQESSLAALKAQLETLDGQLSDNRQARDRLAKEKQELSVSIAEMGRQNETLRKEYEELRKSMGSADAKAKQLAAKLEGLQNKVFEAESETHNWKRAYDQKVAEADKLWGDLAASQKKFSDLAKTMSRLQDSVKNDVAGRLIGKFRENKLDAQVDKSTGEVVLLTGEGFNFEKGSAKLSKEAKVLLKKIIPIYTGVLFEDEKIVSQLASINMEGHSSPSFGKKYVDPEDKNAKAYGFNLRLSAQRASSVAEYLMSEEIGDYPHKARMKTMLQAVGFGYMRPVPLKTAVARGPASVVTPTQDCGPWDCARSQRVQINFILKDNIEEIRKIIDANGGIK